MRTSVLNTEQRICGRTTSARHSSCLSFKVIYDNSKWESLNDVEIKSNEIHRTWLQAWKIWFRAKTPNSSNCTIITIYNLVLFCKRKQFTKNALMSRTSLFSDSFPDFFTQNKFYFRTSPRWRLNPVTIKNAERIAKPPLPHHTLHIGVAHKLYRMY